MTQWAYPVHTCLLSILEGIDTDTPDHCHYRSLHSGRIESGSLYLIDKVSEKWCSLNIFHPCVRHADLPDLLLCSLTFFTSFPSPTSRTSAAEAIGIIMACSIVLAR